MLIVKTYIQPVRNILSDLGVLPDLLCVMHKDALETEKDAGIRTSSVPECLNSSAKTEGKGEKGLVVNSF